MYSCTLRSLHIHYIISNNKVCRVDMQYLLHSCPLLKHLVLGTEMESSTTMAHTSITLIDLWGPSNCVDLCPLLTQEALIVMLWKIWRRVMKQMTGLTMKWHCIFLIR
jgi:hypothetical protein